MALCACAAEHKLKPPYSGIALDRVLPAAADIWISGDPLLQKSYRPAASDQAQAQPMQGNNECNKCNAILYFDAPITSLMYMSV